MVCKRNGETITVTLGENPKDPVLGVSDLLIHLAQKQMEKKGSDFIPFTFQVPISLVIAAVGAERAAGRGCSAPVVVGDGCWLCTRATVLKGVDIPPQTVVAAGAVVVRSVSDRPGGMWAGVPAKAVARA